MMRRVYLIGDPGMPQLCWIVDADTCKEIEFTEFRIAARPGLQPIIRVCVSGVWQKAELLPRPPIALGAVCPECRGTKRVLLLNRSVPCSRCK